MITCSFVDNNPRVIEFCDSRTGQKVVKHYDVILDPIEIFAEAESIEFSKEQLYKVTVETKNSVITHKCKTFDEAKAMQFLASVLIEELNWTRQPAVDSIIEMPGHVLDLYNEGYVKVELIK